MDDYFLSVLNGFGGSWVLERERRGPMRRGPWRHVRKHCRFEFVDADGRSAIVFRGDAWPDGVFEVLIGIEIATFDIKDHNGVVAAFMKVLELSRG
jgi:hypothetical protein